MDFDLVVLGGLALVPAAIAALIAIQAYGTPTSAGSGSTWASSSVGAAAMPVTARVAPLSGQHMNLLLA
jgi:hypothetical protein